MTDVKREIVVSPLFYDALSGEFVPDSDPERRKHTLGRLSMAAVQKGEATQVDRWRRDFEYKPSWAPGVLATAVCSHMPKDKLLSSETEILSLIGVDLADRVNGSSLTVIEEENGLSVIENEITFGLMPLELGPEIARARCIVAARAFSFFRNDYL